MTPKRLTTCLPCPHAAGRRRRGAVAALVIVLLVVLMGMAALTVDVGVMYRARAELQTAADAAAMAAAWEMLDRDRLNGSADMSQEFAAARAEAERYAEANPVMNLGPALAGNDVVFGYFNDPTDPGEAMSFANPQAFNTAMVYTRRTAETNGPIDLLFAAVLGHESTEISAMGAATFKDGAIGFKATQKTGNTGLLPLALHIDAWNNLLSGAVTNGDGWSYDEAAGGISAGADGIRELNLFPGGGVGQLPPGNFGTVDIGSPNNSTADLSRQIQGGVSEADLAWFGGELKLGPDGTLLLNGDTGLSAGIKDDLTAIIGQPRTIPLFSQVSGPGNNAEFTIVGFAGVRIMEVKLTGPMNAKRVIIQPAFVVDDSVITGPGSGTSYFVYKPVTLVR